MTGHTITQEAADAAARTSVTQSRAARELGLKRGEFELAVMLGRIRTVSDTAGGRRRVTREEIERVRAGEGFPEAWVERIRAVGTTEGAALMDISTARFTRLTRAGFVTPVKFYLNRYRAVVWLYLAEELRQFAEAEVNSGLLTGRAPGTIRAQLEAGVDLRARNWRGRHAGALLRQSDDPWERAAAVASLLDPVQIAEIIKDPYERAYVRRLMPDPFGGQGAPDTPAGRIIQKITTADDPDEIRWLRANLTIGLSQARGERPAPRPESKPAPVPAPDQESASGPRSRAELDAEPSPDLGPDHEAPPTALPEQETRGRAQEPRGLLKWMRRRGA
ncbi:DUF6397 family protein [Streptomyces durmitorensis]|uniref:DUF6397 family protein n=1 Tax=Streptomyces durmitorensis TaxID=319947 RepID=A0ABY4Q556_9ACTN|nr:DUF6397 family protein [Streptomyces durmitorensis]UQT60830.1 DUF6397 family protein [Streptomyces durmitorensis]